ncbi:MAG: hypothetical protein CML29_01620 [Rhizobiales bacterium]|nr:hypothetical protein [Hyphomicrobiales bacterium]MBA68055.1 hypothetical protein [Hyphomicrobiales bacterium]|tara:strand:- start:298 stop:1503 length:1206 start_codon:yes stop_codon:yes gene_type:complete
MFIRRLAHTCRSFLHSKDGNFAMLAATLIPLTFAAGSFAVDFANIISMKTRLQDAADGAALATSSQLAAKKITAAEAKQYAEDYFRGMVAESNGSFSTYSATPVATITPIPNGPSTIWQVEVTTIGTQKLTPMAKMVGRSTVHVNVASVSEATTEATYPVSMYLVLDHSGSMGWDSGQTTGVEVTKYCRYWWGGRYECGTEIQNQPISKINVLKKAVADLVADVKASDPDNKYARMGAVSYNNKTTEYDKLQADWDKNRVVTFTNALEAKDGTNSMYAMAWAYDRLAGATSPEVSAHHYKNGADDPAKFIVFMTDGQNETGSSSGDDYVDRETMKSCTDAKNKGVTIFSVAFQAPDRGKALLASCSSGTGFYYDASSADELIAAFKEIGEKATNRSNRLTM